MIHSDAIRSTDGILTAITLTDAVLFIILAMEVELQIIHDFTRFFRQTVLLDQRHDSQFYGSQCCGQFQNDTSFTVVQLFFRISSTHDAQEHTVYTDGCFNNIRSITFVQFRVEIFNTLA